MPSQSGDGRADASAAKSPLDADEVPGGKSRNRRRNPSGDSDQLSVSRRPIDRALRNASVSVAWRLPRPALGRTRHVLLYAATDLFTQHLADLPRAMTQADPIRFWLTTTPEQHRMGLGAQRARSLGLRYVTPHASRLKRWDAIAFSSHAGLNRFDPRVPRIYVPHGLDVPLKARSDGHDWVFGPQNLVDGKPRFDLMFVNSYHRRDSVTAAFPEFGDVIRVSGNPKVDCLLQNAASTPPGEPPVVLIQSTYGPASLIETWGDALFEELERLVSEYSWRFMLSLHPHSFTGYDGARLWGPMAKRRLREMSDRAWLTPADRDWTETMPQAQIAISDHTSLTTSWLLLRRPLYLLRVPEAPVSMDPMAQHLLSQVPEVSQPVDLEPAIEETLQGREFAHGSLPPRDVLVSYVGQSLSRMRAELLQFLDVPHAVDCPDHAPGNLATRNSSGQHDPSGSSQQGRRR